jgi:uncharacterized phage protein gp47/JayE
VQALAGSITRIATPKAGWTSVSNAAAANPGNAVETDSQLRARQQISTAIASVSPMDSLMGTVSAVAGVRRSKGYENDTVTTDVNGVPAHSICVVVEGGESADIAEAIALKKTLGTGTFGTTTVDVLDAGGNTIPIKFSHVVNVGIYAKVTINSLTGYTAITGQVIKDAIVDCINNLSIGEYVYINKIIAAASLWGTAEGDTFTITSVELGREGDSPQTSDNNVAIDFDEVAVGQSDSDLDLVELVVT